MIAQVDNTKDITAGDTLWLTTDNNISQVEVISIIDSKHLEVELLDSPEEEVVH